MAVTAADGCGQKAHQEDLHRGLRSGRRTAVCFIF